jgi:hypothetical protein
LHFMTASRMLGLDGPECRCFRLFLHLLEDAFTFLSL